MKIKSACIRYKGVIYEGRSHCEIGLWMVATGICPRPYPYGDEFQGFVTDDGRYVNRAEGLAIAIANNQIFHKNGNKNQLYSEDLRPCGDKNCLVCKTKLDIP